MSISIKDCFSDVFQYIYNSETAGWHAREGSSKHRRSHYHKIGRITYENGIMEERFGHERIGSPVIR